MKFSDVPKGAYILIPCPRCGDKKRRKVGATRTLKEMRSELCRQCSADDWAATHDLAFIEQRRNRIRLRDGFRLINGGDQ